MSFLPSTQSMYHNHDDANFNGVSEFLMRRSMSYSGLERADEMQPEDDMSDDGSQMLGEKKRRLNIEQVRALEKSFELGNKLEPERKMQLARALGLQPRQIAIWFQNRRARWKTKQLERDYDVLKRQFEAVKADNDALKSHNKKLQSQLMSLKSRDSNGPINLNNKDNEGSWSNGSDNSTCDVNLNTTSTESTLYNHIPNTKNDVVFPSSIGPGAATLTQLLNSSARPGQHAPTMNEGFFNAFSGIEEPTEYWPWPDQQQNFN